MQAVDATEKPARVRRVRGVCTGVHRTRPCKGVAMHGCAVQCLAGALISSNPSMLMDADAAMHRGDCCMVRASALLYAGRGFWLQQASDSAA